MRGKKYKQLRSYASQYRKRMIAANRHHGEPDRKKPVRASSKMWKEMPAEYKARLQEVLKMRGGKAALARYRKFTGLPFPTEILVKEIPGPKDKKIPLVGMGKSPGPQLEGKAKVRGVTGKLPYFVATDSRGKQLFLLPPGDVTGGVSKVRHAGTVAETHYVMSPAEEAAGTFKANKYWVHVAGESGGTKPEGYWVEGSNGNRMFVYGPSTLTVGKWMER